jgi:hypothetical protein
VWSLNELIIAGSARHWQTGRVFKRKPVMASIIEAFEMLASMRLVEEMTKPDAKVDHVYPGRHHRRAMPFVTCPTIDYA